MTTELPLPFPSEEFFLESPFGHLCIYVAGKGPPILLVHSVNALGSSAEVRPLFEAFQKTHTVYAFDLPGFGRSSRLPLRYTIDMMAQSVLQVADWIRERHEGRPFMAVGISLATEFMVRVACRVPSLFKALCLVSPTGFNGRRSLRGPEGSSRRVDWLDRLVRGPSDSWGGFLFRQLTRPGVVRFFLEKTWGSKAIDETLWQYDLKMAQHPNAAYGPLSFLSGSLFSADLHSLYDRLSLPVLVIHGNRGDFTDYRQLPRFQQRGSWQVEVMNTGAMPYFEDRSGFMMRYQEWASRLAL